MTKRKPGIGKGVLDPSKRIGKFCPQRFFPSEELSEYVEHFWEVSWSLPQGERFVQHTIPYPTTHIVFEKYRCEVVGPITGRFTREIVDTGRVVGAHIKPGMFRAFSDTSLDTLVDQRRPMWELLAVSQSQVQALETEILLLSNEQSAGRYNQALLAWLKVTPPPQCSIARDLVSLVESDPSIKRAEALARHAGVSMRSMQRLFKEYIGLSPKFVIQRFRLMEAAERLVNEPPAGGQIASELGFADQAHFIRAFKTLTGVTPDIYAKRNL